MREPSTTLPIHSLAEAYLYLMVAPCEACAGPLRPVEHRVQHDGDAHVLTVPVACKSCGKETNVLFDARGIDPAAVVGGAGAGASVHGLADPHTVPPINPTDEPSRIIDVAGWLTLYTVISEAAQAAASTARTTDERIIARQMLIQAAQCLDEALCFYDADNDLPPEEAFFRTESRQQFRERPELFTRQRLIELRAELPVQRAAGDHEAPKHGTK